MSITTASQWQSKAGGKPAAISEVFTIFWLNPLFIAAGFILPLITVCFLLPANTYSDIWETPKYFLAKEYLLCVITIASLIMGAALSAVLPCKGITNVVYLIKQGEYAKTLLRCYIVATGLCLTAYAIWIVMMLASGIHVADFADMLNGKEGGMSEVREHSNYIAGVTTPMQLGVCVLMLYAMLLNRVRGWLFHGSAWLVVFLTLFRGFFRTERLALMEIAVPSLLVLLRLHWREIPRIWLYIFPAGAVLVPYALFLMTERFRWWANVASVQSMNYFQFCFYHLLGYYATALNNGSAMWQMHFTVGAPTTVLEWFYFMPGIKPYISNNYPGINLSDDDYSHFLKGFLNERFTNPSGIFPVYLDLGLLGGLIFWFFTGFIAMSLYRRFASGELIGLFIFPLFMLGLAELPRITYWPSTRVFSIWCFLWIIILAVSRAKGGQRMAMNDSYLQSRTGRPSPNP